MGNFFTKPEEKSEIDLYEWKWDSKYNDKVYLNRLKSYKPNNGVYNDVNIDVSHLEPLGHRNIHVCVNRAFLYALEKKEQLPFDYNYLLDFDTFNNENCNVSNKSIYATIEYMKEKYRNYDISTEAIYSKNIICELQNNNILLVAFPIDPDLGYTTLDEPLDDTTIDRKSESNLVGTITGFEIIDTSAIYIITFGHDETIYVTKRYIDKYARELWLLKANKIVFEDTELLRIKNNLKSNGKNSINFQNMFKESNPEPEVRKSNRRKRKKRHHQRNKITISSNPDF